MKIKFSLYILISSFVCMTSCDSSISTKNDQITGIELSMNVPDSVLRHVVVFKYKEEATTDQVKKINVAFANLQNQIPEIQDFEWGLNNSPEGLDQNFTHCYMVTFHSEEGRDIYLPHPAHQSFVDLIGPSIEKVFVVDYWTK